MRHPRQVIAALLAVALVAAGSDDIAVAQETVGIRLLDAPANRADDPRARSYIVDHLAPGTTINRRVEVSNDTSEPRAVELYAAAADIEDGTFRFGEGRAANDLTRWTKVSPSSLNLAPAEKGVATVTIAVPDEATTGEQYGVVWAEMSEPASEQQGIGATNRVGVRMYVSVGAGGEPPTDFEVTEIQGRRDEDRNPVVAAVVRNTGGRALDLTGKLQLTEGPGGLSAGPFNANLGTTLKSGQSAPVLFTLDAAVPSGPWEAKVSMRSGTTERDATGTVIFPDEAGTAGPSSKPTSGLSDWALRGISGTITTALILFFIFFWRRRKKKEEEDESEPSEPQELQG